MFELERLPPPDEYGLFFHPDIPGNEESDDVAALCADLGWECEFVPGEELLNDDTCEYDARGWTPDPPPGEGWRLVAVYDTEDGPYAMFVRPNERS